MLGRLTAFVLISAAVSVASMTLTKAVVFRGMRRAIKRRSAFLGELFSCPYCASHWFALAAAILYDPFGGWIFGDDVLRFFVTWLSLVALAALWSKAIYQAFSEMPIEAPSVEELEETLNE